MIEIEAVRGLLDRKREEASPMTTTGPAGRSRLRRLSDLHPGNERALYEGRMIQPFGFPARGHFVVHEEPAQVAGELRSFFRPLRTSG